MKTALLILLTLFAGILAGRADEKIAVFTAGTQIYSNVTVIKVNATDVYFMYTGGMGNVKIKNLSPEWQKHFKFDPDKAQAAEHQLAENKVKYHDQVLQQPVVKAPDMTRLPADTAAANPVLWRNDLPGAMKQAQAEGKPMLLDFTGSDWCPACIQFDRDVLSTSQFAAYAQAKLVLVKVDFPRHTPQVESLTQANETLAQKFQVSWFPTQILLSPDGRELGRQVGEPAGGPSAFIAELDEFGRR